jgi:hypothetical protein
MKYLRLLSRWLEGIIITRNTLSAVVRNENVSKNQKIIGYLNGYKIGFTRMSLYTNYNSMSTNLTATNFN